MALAFAQTGTGVAVVRKLARNDPRIKVAVILDPLS